MHVGHLLLGRPWQYERRAQHDGFRNQYNIVKDGKRTVLVPLTPQSVYRDQLAMTPRRDSSDTAKTENVSKKVNNAECEGMKNSEGRVKIGFFAKEGEIR